MLFFSFGSLLLSNDTLTALDIERIQIDYRDEQAIYSALAANFALTSLRLASCQLSLYSLTLLDRALHQNTTLTSLNVEGNRADFTNMNTVSWNFKHISPWDWLIRKNISLYSLLLPILDI